MALEKKNEMQVRLVPRLLFSAQLFPLKSTVTSHTRIVRYQFRRRKVWRRRLLLKGDKQIIKQTNKQETL